MNYPETDSQFHEAVITEVKGGSFTMDDGFSFMIPEGCKVTPEPGMRIRMYGHRFGRIRGLFLNDEQIYYRTEPEDKEQSEIDLYGADAKDWLARWDRGGNCWSIEMGGLGPGYEQAIHVTCVEILRHLIEAGYNVSQWSKDKEAWEKDRQSIEDHSHKNEAIKALGLSGAQWGAAFNLAEQFLTRGPRAIMNDERVKDRHIQVSKRFP